MNIGLLTSQHLGWACAEIIWATDGVRVVDHRHIARYWKGVAGHDLDFTTREEPDFFLSILWPKLVKPDALAAHLYINLHPAPLPGYRGRNAPAHAIINGEREFGSTLHYMDEGFDTGPIIAESSFDIPADATGRGLYDLAQFDALRLFEETWPVIVQHNGILPCSPQGEGHYYGADSLDRYKRALTFPPFRNCGCSSA